MVLLNTLCEHLDDLLSSQKIIDYCPNGLQLEGKSHLRKVATAVSASLATIEKAIEEEVDALIVHHGLFWQRDDYVIRGVKRQKIALLLEHGISLLAYHLPLDMHTEIGNNWKAAKEMGWTNLQPFCSVNGLFLGVKGELPAIPRKEMQRQLETYYRHPAHSACGGPEVISTAALISGGAHKSIVEAVKDKVDAFITGSFDEPTWHQAFEEKINFFALGHSATERVGPIALQNYIENQFHLPCSFIDIQNPF